MSDEREQRTPQDWPSWADFGEDPLVVMELPDQDDGRGDAFHLPHDALEWLGPAAEMHLVTARRGAVRGDHLHERRRELILVRAAGPWELAWRVPGGDTARRTFREPGAVLLAVEPGTILAVVSSATWPRGSSITALSKPLALASRMARAELG
jgi:hypothetical protein